MRFISGCHLIIFQFISYEYYDIFGDSAEFHQVIYNGGVVAKWCPVALHLAKLLQAEILLLSALPVISDDTPPHILQRLLTESRQIEAQLVGRLRRAINNNLVTIRNLSV